MQAALPNVQQWGARDGVSTYVITCDTGCVKDDIYYGRFSVSVRFAGSRINTLGIHDTLEQAKAAAEATRKP
jgi:hypothetical protein